MRKALKELGKEEQHRFKGTVETFGSKSVYKHAEKTLCLKDTASYELETVLVLQEKL